jgi:hypothetical protein
MDIKISFLGILILGPDFKPELAELLQKITIWKHSGNIASLLEI